MVLESVLCITNEEVFAGALPEWLRKHLIAQCRDFRPVTSGGPARILVIHPSQEARRECLVGLAGEGVVIDRTLHHTLESLETSLLADLRMPRALSLSGGWEMVLNEACAAAATRLEFPILNPLPTMPWGEHKTEALAQLHALLAREGCLKDWDGPGIDAFSRILRRLAKELGGTHPDFVTSGVIERLEEWVKRSEAPFSLQDVSGVILLDHAPVMGAKRRELLVAISRHRPLHQLVHPGNFRLGQHGLLLFDEQPVRKADGVLGWLPEHEPLARGAEPESSHVTRLMVQREEHSMPFALDALACRLRENPDVEVIIIDPSLEENRWRWQRGLADHGIPIASVETMASGKSLGHWLAASSEICHGPNCFALESLRALALQGSITLFEAPASHPTEARIRPSANADLMTEIARSEHVLGGPGSLRRWMETLARETTDERSALAKESTQWWLLCLAKTNEALLAEHDRVALGEPEMWIGCHSRRALPQPTTVASGDEWLTATLSRVDLAASMRGSSGSESLSATVVQSLVDAHHRLRRMQESLGQSSPAGGVDWVEELSNLLRTTPVPAGGGITSGRIRLLTPSDALGCTADLIILCNLSSSSWDLRVPKIAFLGDEERHTLDIQRPDSPIRQARHHLSHLLAAAREDVIILDPSLDDASPAAAPIREWAKLNDPGDAAEQLPARPETSASPRHQRRVDGENLDSMQPPSRSPLNPRAVSIPLDIALQRDRERREPKELGPQGYLPEENRPSVWGIGSNDLLRKPPASKVSPRAADRWPVIGGPATIDPRPLLPQETRSQAFDNRHGHGEGAGQAVPKWSASRLKDWLSCPRKGWLSRELRTEEEEKQQEDLDARTHGELLHEVHHQLLRRVLGMEEGIERDIGEVLAQNQPLNIADSELSDAELFQIALEELDRLAPWLERTDAVSTNRLRMLTGFDRRDWRDWLVNPRPTPPSGRVGTIVSAEAKVRGSMPIAYEWEAMSHDERGIEISLAAILTSPAGEQLPSIRLRGMIDRVDLLSFDIGREVWVDDAGSASVAPIRIFGTDWKPRRLVIIRDLKTAESKKRAKNRHALGLLEEVQLALYARAWEVAHPGDLVVGAGISVMGHETEHWVEVSSHIPALASRPPFGTQTDLTKKLHRFPDEGPNPESDAFRAWLAQRLSVALGAAAGAAAGRVHATPSQEACMYCRVASICPVAIRGDPR